MRYFISTCARSLRRRSPRTAARYPSRAESTDYPPLLRTPVPPPNLRRCECPPADRHIQLVVGVNIIGSPAKIAGGHESRVADHHELEQQEPASEDRAYVSHSTYSRSVA